MHMKRPSSNKKLLFVTNKYVRTSTHTAQLRFCARSFLGKSEPQAFLSSATGGVFTAPHCCVPPGRLDWWAIGIAQVLISEGELGVSFGNEAPTVGVLAHLGGGYDICRSAPIVGAHAHLMGGDNVGTAASEPDRVVVLLVDQSGLGVYIRDEKPAVSTRADLVDRDDVCSSAPHGSAHVETAIWVLCHGS